MKTFQGESQANGTNIMCYRTSKKEKPVAFTSQEVRHEVSLEGWGAVFALMEMKKEGIGLRKSLCEIYWAN